MLVLLFSVISTLEPQEGCPKKEIIYSSCCGEKAKINIYRGGSAAPRAQYLYIISFFVGWGR